MKDAKPRHRTRTSVESATFVESLEAGREEMRNASSGLNERIQSFEAWIAKLPGRVETTVVTPDPAGSPEKFCLRLKRVGKEWHLEFCYVHEAIDDLSEEAWEPVAAGNTRAKLAAIQAVPKLVESMPKALHELVAEIRSANAAFDSFAASIGFNPRAGG